ncbi:DHS-like NAD/FAD-binding domain-containing protein [Tricharina praecox]|uniref:DHS-like NAD/FAD-binding domain-containing protein n=1 Tax=Tricharina praecox TaxID=43433 RepID=UPI0022202FE9|nr:DHS-like NAD/FAD-binding domain-containing protein [Tricharina praecox]KAI5857008.1 DHS-like NAD/FAD-binding domain-containing protein [Tricharina praecox]
MVLPRIPYTAPFPPPTLYPAHATSLPAAIAVLHAFLSHPSHRKTALISGAGISVASGLRDYRGTSGTYRLNQHYRPIFFHEFASQHASRQRYWARSFVGWPATAAARPNAAHRAVYQLRAHGALCGVVTQNVDSLHGVDGGVLELHGFLRAVACLACKTAIKRDVWQAELERLNPLWAGILQDGGGEKLRMNADGDVDLPSADYTQFRYPPCPVCLAEDRGRTVRVDQDGGMEAGGDGVKAVVKPCVTFFGESVDPEVKVAAERLVEEADAVLVVGSSLATYSAWRLVRDAERAGKGVAVVNIGGVRGEDAFFGQKRAAGERVRLEVDAAGVLAGVVEAFGGKSEPAKEQPYLAASWTGVGG